MRPSLLELIELHPLTTARIAAAFAFLAAGVFLLVESHERYEDGRQRHYYESACAAAGARYLPNTRT